ncbi:Calcium uptake protein 1, mitochondrial [Coccomyxa sp. Obi]|nr:Calcium uptake protein 1, mitochondrial [Coccomyxa sp. Obi]
MWRRVGTLFVGHARKLNRAFRGREIGLADLALVPARLNASTNDYRWFPLAALCVAVPLSASAEEKKEGWHLLDLDIRRKTFFKYEKRIRDLSPPDKVFDYFASITGDDGTRYMTPADLLHSLVAVYPAEGSGAERSGALRGDRRVQSPLISDTMKSSDFFKQFDADGDGYISFSEYLMIVTFLAIPLEDVETIFAMFDDDDSGAISLEEFLRVTTALRSRLRRVSHLRRTGLQTDKDESQGLLLTFFGPKGQDQLDLKHFAAFCTDLHAELVKLEFLHYDSKAQGYIPGISFAHSLVSHCRMQTIDQFLTRIDRMPDAVKTLKVTWKEFQQFAQLRQNVHKLAVALDFFYSTCARIGRADFQRAVAKILGQPLAEDMVDIIFAIYDADQDDDLAYKDFLYALQKREGNLIYAKQMLDLDSGNEGESVFSSIKSLFAK